MNDYPFGLYPSLAIGKLEDVDAFSVQLHFIRTVLAGNALQQFSRRGIDVQLMGSVGKNGNFSV